MLTTWEMAVSTHLDQIRPTIQRSAKVGLEDIPAGNDDYKIKL
jgi:hypothetical protein